MEETEAVVVGAGPAGSSAARVIAESGHEVLLLEKDRYSGETAVCGGGLAGDFAERALARLPRTIVEKYITDWLIYMPDKTYHLANQPGLSVCRREFDRFLAEDAASKGANLRVQTVATNLRREGDRIVINVRDRAVSRQYAVKSKLVVFADGPCTMARMLGLGFPRAKPDITIHAAIYELEWRNNPLNCFEFFFDEKVSPWGYGWVFPKRDFLNVGVGCLISQMKGNIGAYLNYFVEKYERVWGCLRTLRRIRFAADIIPIAHAPRIVGDNAMAVGDAAGMVDPIWGGGIGMAMEGASIAGQVAAAALEEGRFDASFLTQYETRWKKTADYKYLRRAHWAHELFLKYSTFDRHAFLKFMRLALWKGNSRELKLSPADLLAKGVSGVSNLPVST